MLHKQIAVAAAENFVQRDLFTVGVVFVSYVKGNSSISRGFGTIGESSKMVFSSLQKRTKKIQHVKIFLKLF